MRECCTDHKGEPKKKYPTEEEAQRSALRLEQENGIGVQVYQCEERNGWHLTSQNVNKVLRPINMLTDQERKFYSPNNKRRNRSALGHALGNELISQLKEAVPKEAQTQKRERLRKARIASKPKR